MSRVLLLNNENEPLRICSWKRALKLLLNGKPVGIFGEIHPSVLENWAVSVPCVAGELDIESLM